MVKAGLGVHVDTLVRFAALAQAIALKFALFSTTNSGILTWSAFDPQR